MEFYGEHEGQEDQQASSSDYQSKVEEFQKSGAKLIRVAKSVHVLSKPDSPGVAILLPFYLETNPTSMTEARKGGKAGEPGKAADTEDAPVDLNEVQLIDSEAAQSESLRELRALQQELRGLIRQRKMFKKATSGEAKDRIIDLLLQIQKIQESKCIPSSLPPG